MRNHELTRIARIYVFLYLVAGMIMFGGMFTGIAMGCDPIEPPCIPACVCTGCGLCGRCGSGVEAGGCEPDYKQDCESCKESTGERLNNCLCGAPCVEVRTDLYVCDFANDDCNDETESCCPYGPDYQQSDCYDINCQYCDHAIGPQPVQITAFNYFVWPESHYYVTFGVETEPQSRCRPDVVILIDGSIIAPMASDGEGNCWWYYTFPSCVGPHYAEAFLCGSSAFTPVVICNSGYPDCERCNADTGNCDLLIPCYGSCCDPKQCQSCDPVTQTCQSNCDPDLCEDCNTATGQCQSKCNLENCQECNNVTHACEVCGNRPGEHCCNGCCIATIPNCGEAGSHDSSIHWVETLDDYMSSSCTIFGRFNAYEATYEVAFKYQSCQWKCEISNVIAEEYIRVRDPASVSQKSVSSASEVPCSQAAIAKTDLDDTDLSDGYGAPRTQFWCYNATVAHEERHRNDWKDMYGCELNSAIAAAEAITVNIDCGDPSTKNCMDVYLSKINQIGFFFIDAKNNALNQFNNPSTPIDEAEVRAYQTSYTIEHPISAALPGGCTP